jgi:hypothetical protein
VSKQTTLSEAQVAQSHDVVTVELVQPGDMPAIVRITWPAQPSIVDPARFGDTAGALVKMFSTQRTSSSPGCGHGSTCHDPPVTPRRPGADVSTGWRFRKSKRPSIEAEMIAAKDAVDSARTDQEDREAVQRGFEVLGRFLKNHPPHTPRNGRI